MQFIVIYFFNSSGFDLSLFWKSPHWKLSLSLLFKKKIFCTIHETKYKFKCIPFFVLHILCIPVLFFNFVFFLIEFILKVRSPEVVPFARLCLDAGGGGSKGGNLGYLGKGSRWKPGLNRPKSPPDEGALTVTPRGFLSDTGRLEAFLPVRTVSSPIPLHLTPSLSSAFSFTSNHLFIYIYKYIHQYLKYGSCGPFFIVCEFF